MTDTSPKEVNWHDYCPKCVHEKTLGYEEPCNTCLERFYNWDTDQPTEYEEKTK